LELAEGISIFLAITTAIAGTLAYAYKWGKVAGIDLACGKRIENKLEELKTEGDEIHKELKAELHEVHSKIDKLQGSFETFKHLVKTK
jgi:argininosuccinate lyase